MLWLYSVQSVVWPPAACCLQIGFVRPGRSSAWRGRPALASRGHSPPARGQALGSLGRPAGQIGFVSHNPRPLLPVPWKLALFRAAGRASPLTPVRQNRLALFHKIIHALSSSLLPSLSQLPLFRAGPSAGLPHSSSPDAPSRPSLALFRRLTRLAVPTVQHRRLALFRSVARPFFDPQSQASGPYRIGFVLRDLAPADGDPCLTGHGKTSRDL